MIDVKTIFSAQKRLLKKILKKLFLTAILYDVLIIELCYKLISHQALLMIVFHVYKRMMGINDSLNILRRRRNKDSGKLKFTISHSCKKLLTSLNLLTPLTKVM